MRVGIVTTLNHNIGDDFVRVGITNVFNKLRKAGNVEYVLVNKHEPLSAYPGRHPLNWMGRIAKNLPRGRRRFESYTERLLHPLGGSRLHDCDVIIQSGAPVLFNGCAHAEWAVPIWQHIAGELSTKVPVMNIAAGSCYSWQAQPVSVTALDDAEFLRQISSICRLTTVRERLAHRLMASLGVDTHLLPCAALLSGVGTFTSATDSSPILINYMEGGGHYSFGQEISEKTWLDTLSKLIGRLEKHHDVRFVCHSKQEYETVRREFPNKQAFLPKSMVEYFQIISQAKCGIFNRLHASVALGGIGAPSVAIGTDTRMLMLAEIGIPYRFIAEADINELENQVEELLANRGKERDRLLALRDSTLQRYSDLIGSVLGKP